MLIRMVIAENCCTYIAFEVFVPQTIDALLLDQVQWHCQLFAGNEKACACLCWIITLLLPARLVELMTDLLKLLHKIPACDIHNAVNAQTIDAVIAHPMVKIDQHKST